MSGIALEHFRDEAFTTVRNACILRIGVVAVFNFGVSGFDVAGFERRPSNSQSVGNHAQTPNIDFERVPVKV